MKPSHQITADAMTIRGIIDSESLFYVESFVEVSTALKLGVD